MSKTTLITNVNIFDGVNEQCIENASVLIDGNRIEAISTEEIDAKGGVLIDGGGRMLIPGLIDSHWHMMLAALHSFEELTSEQADYIHARILKESENTLLRGFTTVRAGRIEAQTEE